MIAFHGVKKSPLIIRIVDRIKINSEQLLPFSESEQSLTFCKLHVKCTPVSFIFAAIAQVCINLHRQHIMSFIQWWCERWSKSHVAKEISGRGRRRSRDEKGNQGVGDLRFINILQLFSIYFFQLLYFIIFFYTFFTHDIYPHPRPTTSTHYPRPTTFSYTRGNRTGMYAEIFVSWSLHLFAFWFFWKGFFFTHDIYPHPHPRPTTHDLYPLPTTHDI